MMTPEEVSLEDVIKATKKIEAFLEKSYGATGRGLHDKITSVEDKLTKIFIRKARKIATIRNKLLHQHGFELNDKVRYDFAEAYGYVKYCLENTSVKDLIAASVLVEKFCLGKILVPIYMSAGIFLIFLGAVFLTFDLIDVRTEFLPFFDLFDGGKEFLLELEHKLTQQDTIARKSQVSSIEGKLFGDISLMVFGILFIIMARMVKHFLRIKQQAQEKTTKILHLIL